MSKAPKKKIDLTGVDYNPLFEEIIIHHTATPRQKKYDVDWCRRLHTGKGWQDIGYHLYVEFDGKVSLGRPLHKRGAHCRPRNTVSFGIAFVGGLNKDGDAQNTITPTQMRSVAECIAELRRVTGKELPVYSHRNFSATFCPGFDASEVDWKAKLNERARNPVGVRKTDSGAAS